MSIKIMFGETIGDIPMYSLHRIKRLLLGPQGPEGVSDDMRHMLSICLIEANSKYKEESGNDWSCLTSNNLVWALERLDRKAAIAVKQMKKGQPKEMRPLIDRIIMDSQRIREDAMEIIKRWFDENSESILYDMNGKIPWGVVRNLRRRLSFWIASKNNPFHDDIEASIIEIAKENGVQATNAQEAWEIMGGKVFTPS